VAILLFFLIHWQVSVFFQSFFQHRYSAHRQFTMSPGWERVFYVLDVIAMGTSYMSPKAYAILHRMHHAYSDTPQDPHSPNFHRHVGGLVKAMLDRFGAVHTGKEKPELRFEGGYPEWPALDHVAQSWPGRLAWGAVYTGIYVWLHLTFGSSLWFFLLLPFHWLLGPIHGTIVNWCGHKYGYRNFANADTSRNTLVFDVLTAGELFQNNHHMFGMSPNFAARWYEIDPTYQVMRLFHALGIIDMSGSTLMPSPETHRLGLTKHAKT
jgi:stearoyl-CoA desaturase (delta-9 desaturase)